MCGRYGFAPGEFREIKIRFNILNDIPLFAPRYNIAPSQPAPVIAKLEGANRVELFQWGLVSSNYPTTRQSQTAHSSSV